MTYTTQEIETFGERWNSYIKDFDWLKLAAPVEEMDEIAEAQEALRNVVESAVESFEGDHE